MRPKRTPIAFFATAAFAVARAANSNAMAFSSVSAAPKRSVIRRRPLENAQSWTFASSSLSSFSSSCVGLCFAVYPSFSSSGRMVDGESLLSVISRSVSKSLSSGTGGDDDDDASVAGVQLKPFSGGMYSVGGGASSMTVVDENSGRKYFVKKRSASGGGSSMFRAEYFGVKAMEETGTIRVPKPIAYGEGGPLNTAFVVFEHLNLVESSNGAQYELGVQLAKMHRNMSPDLKFRFHVDGNIGDTPQPNLPWMDDWPDFWNSMRLGHMLRLTRNAGLSADKAKALRAKTRELFSSSSHDPAPSLLHGDLWGGNRGFVNEGADGGTDREADVAMTYLFGGFSNDFYDGYESEWPLPDGHEKRRTVYNLYHILNHDVMFGGMYIRQAQGMIDQILEM